MISMFLNLLRLDFCSKMWSILENVPHAVDNKVYSSAFRCKVLKISIRSIWSNVSLKACVSLLSFSSDVQSIGVNRVLKSPTIIELLSISPFMAVSNFTVY